MSDLVGDARYLSRSAQEALRLRAVAALVAGRDREDVATVFGGSLKAVDRWWAKWQVGGRDALVMRPRGKPVGVHQVLGEDEQAAVRQAVLDHRPSEVGLPGQLWTRRLIGELIAKLYRVRPKSQSRPVGSSAGDNVSHTSSAATSADHPSATPSTRTS
ncbi:transposase [Streptomyces atroolivaceus]|uniref:transposase n=1 Tax=Streptomyces atroolivaceus TaxID=66869 RepID=UPI00379E5FDF